MHAWCYGLYGVMVQFALVMVFDIMVLYGLVILLFANNGSIMVCGMVLYRLWYGAGPWYGAMVFAVVL